MSEQLESIYPNLLSSCDPCAKQECETRCSGFGSNRFAYFILWWLILVVIIWFIIYSLQPSWVMKPCDDDHGHGHHKHKQQVDQGKAILVAIIIALILVIIFYLIARSYWY